MKKNKKSKASPKVDPFVEGLMAKLLDRLVSIEKKLDAVVSQTAGRAADSKTVQSVQTHKPAQPQPHRPERQMYEAICADCAKVCEVPFKPSEDRAVYCKTCWAARRSGGSKNNGPSISFTPVAVKPKPASKLSAAALSAAAVTASAPPMKAKKASANKAKKKKR